MKKTNIYLIGPMGSGKTTIGKRVAKLLKRPFYDSDQEIENRAGVNIPWIFDKEGESGFRQREAEIIASFCQLDNIVLSTGGGVVVTPANRDQLCRTGVVVYLKVPIEKQLARISRRKGSRPMLLVDNPQQKLKELNEEREPLYQEIASLTYCTDQYSQTQIAKQIAMDIQQLGDTA